MSDYERLPAVMQITGGVVRMRLPTGKLDEAKAHGFLRDVFLAEEANRYAMGAYFKLLTRRHDLWITTNPVSDLKRDCLLFHLNREEEQPLSDSLVLSALGFERVIHETFWTEGRRLEIALAFFDVPASLVLVEVGKYNPRAFTGWKGLRHASSTLHFVDRCYMDINSVRHPSPDQAFHLRFREFLRGMEFLKRNNIELACFMCGLPPETEVKARNKASAWLYRRLNGTNQWSVPTFERLCAFYGMKPQDMVAMFDLWLEHYLRSLEAA